MATKKSAAKEEPNQPQEETTQSHQTQGTKTEEFKLNGDEIVKKFKEIIAEGNAKRIIIKNEKGISILEIPVTIGVIGILLAPYLAAIGALAAVLTNCSIIVEKRN